MVTKSLCFLFVFLTLSLLAFVPEPGVSINGAGQRYKATKKPEKRFFQKERDFWRPFHATSNDFSRDEAKPAGYDEGKRSEWKRGEMSDFAQKKRKLCEVAKEMGC